jgi:hypothetical protein
MTKTALAYSLGVEHEAMPAPLIAEHCTEVAAGPVRFVVEGRFLADDMAELKLGGAADDPNHAFILNDGGGSVHVFGVTDAVEHLRFDCFETHPHYHYIDNRRQRNVIVRIDEIALGDPITWTIERLHRRLPEMLECAGAHSLAEAVRSQTSIVTAAVELVEQLLERARAAELARRQRHDVPAGAPPGPEPPDHDRSE